MSVSAIVDEIESQEFDSLVGVASGRRTFFRAMEGTDQFRALVGFLALAPGASEAILDRIRLLAGLRVDPRYENPKDAALAAYCWGLTKANREYGRVAAEIIAEAPQTWWAREVSGFVLHDEFQSSGATSETFTHVWNEAVNLLVDTGDLEAQAYETSKLWVDAAYWEAPSGFSFQTDASKILVRDQYVFVRSIDTPEHTITIDQSHDLGPTRTDVRSTGTRDEEFRRVA